MFVLNYALVAQTSWGAWGAWSSTEVPMCENGQRSRQRMCINTTVVFCDIDCTFGNTIDDFQCCVGMWFCLTKREQVTMWYFV